MSAFVIHCCPPISSNVISQLRQSCEWIQTHGSPTSMILTIILGIWFILIVHLTTAFLHQRRSVLANGADAQCQFNRSGVLCGSCQQDLTFSLGSSHCLSCHRYWPFVSIVVLLASVLVGIFLVIMLLVLNMTIADGLINSFIFYANIVAASGAVLSPSSEPSFPTVFIAWLNLDIGFDVCFFPGLDAYSKK